MLKKTISQSSSGTIVLVDSITKVEPRDEGAIVLSASHGGLSSGEFALQVPLRLVLFNDAGFGKDGAGVASLDMLQDRGVAAAMISHLSGRIGDAQDMWDHGEISAVNALAAAMGVAIGEKASVRLLSLIGNK